MLTSNQARLLIVDDESANMRALCETLRAQGYHTAGFDSAEAALDAMDFARFDLLLADLMMPGTDGIALVKAARARDADLACVIMTGEGSIASAVQAMQVGALDYILKPCKLSAILPVLARALETRQLRIENAALERKLHEHIAALGAANHDLELARREAERSNQAKSSFLATMSHELRTPLNAILGFAQILNSPTLPSTPEQKKTFARHIQQAARHLLTLINEVLDLAKVESGTLSLSLETVELSEALQECQVMIAPLADQRGITVRFPVRQDLHLVCDRTRLKQVLLNLLSNAIKYNRQHGSVTVDCGVAAEGRLRVSVRDTGAGLDALQLRSLFEPFNRLGRDGGNEEGTGIGLALTRRLIELMGGSINVDSTVGVGSVFRFELPIGDVALPPLVAPAPATEDVQPQRSRSRKTLLYIDDNPANLALVQEIVRPRADLHLLSAADGQFGLESARLWLPHVILLDINMPGMGGYEVFRILRSDPRTAQIPVIALTAAASADEVARGVEAGFFRFIGKPISVESFTTAVDCALAFGLVAPAQGTMLQ